MPTLFLKESALHIPELLVPAGNMDKLLTGLLYGADALYLGGKSGNLRSACEGFTRHELVRAGMEAGRYGAKIYYCLNSIAMENDLPRLPEQLEEAASAGVHGLIIADPGVLRLARKYAPGIPVHLSTQANTSNSSAVAFWAEQGLCRANLARELSCREIHAVRKACPDMELEVFVHGAMCLALSGQCLLSAWLNRRSGNQGRCTQPCRFEYRALGLEDADCERENEVGMNLRGEGFSLNVEERTRPGEPLWRVEQEERFSSFWAPQDLCLLPWLRWFAANRIDALKIEGRMKSAGWLAHVVDVYRTALNGLQQSGVPRATLLRELLYAATRPLGSGFFLHGKRRDLTGEFLASSKSAAKPNRSGESSLPDMGKRLLARVLEEKEPGLWLVEAHGNWSRSDDVEIMLPGLQRPVLVGGSYGLENQRGQLAGELGNGNRGLLYADLGDIRPGVFIRSA